MSNRKILIADNYTLSRNLLSDLCERNHPGFSVEVYQNGRDLEDRILKRGFDGVALMILENVMGAGPRGVDVVKKYSGVACEAGCRIILYSIGEQDVLDEGVRNSIFAYIEKAQQPLEEVERTIARALL